MPNIKQIKTPNNTTYDILDANAYHVNDTEETIKDNLNNDDFIPFYETSGTAAPKKMKVSNLINRLKTLLGLGTASTRAYTTSVTQNSDDLVTSGAVWTAIDELPEPMVFRGSLGTGGTITSLPTNGTATIGDTYKVIKDGTYAGTSAKVGDTFICVTKTSSANTWTLIPSGDEPSGTVTSVTIKATSPIAIDSSAAITTSGTRTISHVTSGVTAGSYGDSSAKTPSYGGTFKVPYITVNDTGHVTGISAHNVTIPASDNTDRYVNSASFTDDTTSNSSNPVKMTLTRAGSDTIEVTGNIPKVSSTSAGVVPKGAAVSSQSQSTKFLRSDGTWQAPSYTTNTDTQVTQNGLTNSDSTWRRILFGTNSNSTETGEVYKFQGLSYQPSSGYLSLNSQDGIKGTVKYNEVRIGNNTGVDTLAEGEEPTVNKNVKGRLRLYSNTTTNVVLTTEDDKITSSRTLYLPNKDGTLATTNDVPTVNNTTITLQQNGTTVDTFTTNQASNKTINVLAAVNNELNAEDLNTVKVPGFYVGGSGNTCKNKPSGVLQFGLFVIRSATSANYYKQTLIRPNTEGEEWTRTCTNGTWSSWVKSEFTDTTYSFADGTNEFTVTPSGGTASTIKVTPQLKIDGITSDTTDKEINCYGECSTAAGTAAKTVSITKGTFALAAGSKVIVKFTNANTANNPTLNVNSKGAKNIFHNGARITTGANKALLAGTIEFVYDGTQFQLVGNYIDSNTEYTVDTSTGLSMSNNQIAIDKVPIENGGTNATTRLDALKNLTNQSVSTPNYFFGMTTSWATGGYVTVANSTKVLKQSLSCISMNDSAITTSNRWHKVAEVTATTANIDYGIMLSVCNTFTNNTAAKENSCILVAHVRMAAVGTHQSASLKIIANGGFSADQFKLMYKETASTNVKYEIWTDIDTRYMGRRFTVMNEGIRTDAFANSWTLNKSTSGGNLPSGYVTVKCVDETVWKPFNNGSVILCKTSQELMADTCTDIYFKIAGLNRIYSFQLPMDALNQTSDSADFQMTVGYYKSASNNENITFRLWHNSNKVKIRCVEAIQNGTSIDADTIGFYAYYKG